MDASPKVKSAKTAFDIVDILVDLDGATVTELSEELDRPTSTVHDYLQTLAEEGYVVREGREYNISTRFLEYGARRRKRMALHQATKPELQRLADETGEHASLMIEEDGLGVLLYTAKGEKAVQVNTYDGARSKLHMTAPGKAILAHLSEDERDDIIDRWGLTPRTEATITSRETLEAELAGIRDQGYATDDQEMFEGMRAVATPLVTSADRVQGAISVYGPVNRLDDERFTETIPEQLKNTANVLQVNLTYS